jgi:uncharacterized protein
MKVNRLIHETSPYLLQHAHNPVDWFPWSEEAFAKAREENKPVLVSIGYAACHWCHVMERESFEDSAVAQFMNARFVNIKVDREERPDVDHIYMDAVQAMSGSGGWPLNVFLFPDGKPFYGGTYFPPQRAFNRASWMEVLNAVSNAYKEKETDLISQADNLTNHLKAGNQIHSSTGDFHFDIEKTDFAFSQLMTSADEEWGGFGRAPKFPQTFAIGFLLRYSFLRGNKQAEKQALLSIDKMIEGGMYDQFGGGFARYSTDTEWLVPHFEKMLYDNALLLNVMAEALQLTGDKKYRQTISETAGFIERELTHPAGGFYSALDADSEGEEGKYYVWDYDEAKQLLGDDGILFCAYYDITPAGNWEGKNIPRVKLPAKEFATQHGISEEKLHSVLSTGRQVLLAAREKRVHPGLDDKILLGWNALMNHALSKAYAATGEERYKNLAIKNMVFMLEAFNAGDKGLFHTWKDNKARIPAFLDDYSYLVAALLELAKVTMDYSWVDNAAELAGFVEEKFSVEDRTLFYYTPDFQSDILLRKIELYDGATPSGNSVMARNLYELSLLLNRPAWRHRAEKMVAGIGEVAGKYPTSFGGWLCLLMEITTGTNEVVILGPGAEDAGRKLLKSFVPHTILMVSHNENDHFPLLEGKKINGKTLFFLCKNYACQAPVFSLEALNSAINANNLYHMQ